MAAGEMRPCDDENPYTNDDFHRCNSSAEDHYEALGGGDEHDVCEAEGGAEGESLQLNHLEARNGGCQISCSRPSGSDKDPSANNGHLQRATSTFSGKRPCRTVASSVLFLTFLSMAAIIVYLLVKTPSSGSWGSWSSWSGCSVTCGRGGSRMRFRNCEGGSFCALGGGTSFEQVDCATDSLPPCRAVPGNWTGWVGWSACTKTCGEGVRSRTRRCLGPVGASCQGNYTEEEHCTVQECPVAGSWSPWTSWSSCSASCDKGISTRHRSCLGSFCDKEEGDDLDVEECRGPPCGTWSPWTSWNSCSGPCGSKSRGRRCNRVGEDEHDARDPVCPGGGSEHVPCHECVGPGSAWGNWTDCPSSCGSRGSVVERRRVCQGSCDYIKLQESTCQSASCGCNVTLKAREGYIFSPNYPKSYDVNLTCEYDLQLEEGRTVRIELFDFQLENNTLCAYDSLALRDPAADDVELAKICSEDETGRSFDFSANRALLLLKTDYSVNRRGFKLFYSSDPAYVT